MKKLSQVRMGAVVVIGLLSPVSLLADSTTVLDPHFFEDFNQAKALLEPVTADKKAVDVKQLKKKAKEIEKLVITDEKERANNEKIAANTKSIDSKIEKYNLIQSFVPNALKNAKVANDKLQGLISRLGTSPSGGVSAQDIDTSGSHAVCSRGTNLPEFKKFADMMQSEPFQNFRRDAGKAVSKHKDELFDRYVKSMLDQIHKARETQKQQAALKEEAQPNVEDQLAHLDLKNADQRKVEARVARQENEVIPRTEKMKQEWDDKLSNALETVLVQLSDLKKNRLDKVQELIAPFADKLESLRKASHDSAVANASRLYKNCRKTANELGKDNPSANGTLLHSAYETVLAYYNTYNDPNATSIAQQFAQKLNATARQNQCQKVAATIDQELGNTMKANINAIRTATDPTTALEAAIALSSKLGRAQEAVGKKFKPALEQCDRIAQLKDKVENFVGNVRSSISQMIAQQQQPRQAGLFGAPQQRQAPLNQLAAGGPATHSLNKAQKN